MTPQILNKLKARTAATNSKRLGSLAKANAEILNLAKSAGYTGTDPEAALVHLERRSVAAVSVNAPLAKTSPTGTRGKYNPNDPADLEELRSIYLSAQPSADRKSALWAEYNSLPVSKRNAFYAKHRSEMSSAAPAVIMRTGGKAK
jgi:hypothetical protein